MSIWKLVPTLLVAVLALGVVAAPAQAQNVNVTNAANIVITDVDIDPADLDIVGGVLTLADGAVGTVSGTIAGLPFTTDITDFALDLTPDQPGGGGPEVCSVLHLALAPIDLDVLGLHVDTSAICLDITAIEGGGLLGDLLCGLAGGLNLPNLGGLDDLLEGLPQVLTGALQGGIASNAPPTGEPADICDGDLEILDLAVGPVNLNVLGLVVNLDNCENGPVQVCVSASRGEGILGDLLTGLLGSGGLLPDLGAIADLLDDLKVTKALRDGEVSKNELKQITKKAEKLLRKS